MARTLPDQDHRFSANASVRIVPTVLDRPTHMTDDLRRKRSPATMRCLRWATGYSLCEDILASSIERYFELPPALRTLNSDILSGVDEDSSRLGAGPSPADGGGGIQHTAFAAASVSRCTADRQLARATDS